jgi:phosphatidylinositol 4-kinase
VRPYQEQIVALVALMLDAKFPCFRKPDTVLDELRYCCRHALLIRVCSCSSSFLFQHSARFQPGKSEAEAAAFMKKTIDGSYRNWRSTGYDMIQYKQNAIPFFSGTDE